VPARCVALALAGEAEPAGEPGFGPLVMTRSDVVATGSRVALGTPLVGYFTANTVPQLLVPLRVLEPDSEGELRCFAAFLEPTARAGSLEWGALALLLDDSPWLCSELRLASSVGGQRDEVEATGCKVQVGDGSKPSLLQTARLSFSGEGTSIEATQPTAETCADDVALVPGKSGSIASALYSRIGEMREARARDAVARSIVKRALGDAPFVTSWDPETAMRSFDLGARPGNVSTVRRALIAEGLRTQHDVIVDDSGMRQVIHLVPGSVGGGRDAPRTEGP
jgi:hypothetical protein